MTLPLIEVKELDQHGNDTSFATHGYTIDPWKVQLQAQANSPAKEQRWANSNDITTKPVVEVYEWPEFTR